MFRSIKRGQRKRLPLPTDQVAVPNYPNEPTKPTKMKWWMAVAPVIGIAAMSIAFGILYQNYLYPIIITTVSLVYPGVMLLRQREQRRIWQEKSDELQNAYRSRIEKVEHQLETKQQQQREYLRWTFPNPQDLVNWPQKNLDRIWERRPRDPDFLQVRLGEGEVDASYEVRVPNIEIPELAPQLLLEARDMGLSYTRVSDVPRHFDLREMGSLGISGPRRLREGAARAVVSGLAALHAPVDLSVFGVLPANRISEWDWMKWLPHAHALEAPDGQVHIAYERDRITRLLAGLLDELEARTIKEVTSGDPFLLLIVADWEAVRGEVVIKRLLSEGPHLNAGLVLLAPSPRDLPSGCRGRLDVTNEKSATCTGPNGDSPDHITPDAIGEAGLERLSRGLAPIRLADSQLAGGLPDQIRLMELEASPDLDAVDFRSRWMAALTQPPNLRIPIGMRHGSRGLVLDLKQSGHGPHGLIAGTTGSGKSELLLTLLSGLAFSNHPHHVNFVLVDYKGGTAMSVLSALPHTVGVVTDLDGKQTRRALVALRSELTRREEILARHEVADIDKYHQLGISDPFPYLFIVIDEFAELKERFKNDLGEILNEFVSVAQKGRALGVHLILAMQRPEGVVNESIRANMRYRICLRVERAEDSRNVLGRPDAYLLPSRPPGRAYFQVGKDEQFDLFQVARVAGFYRPDQGASASNEPVQIQEVAPDGRRILLYEVERKAETEQRPSKEALRTEAQILVEKAAAAAEQMGIERLKSPWPPQLPKELPLEIAFELAEQQVWDGGQWPPSDSGIRKVPIGLLDEPSKQRQLPLIADLESDGNLLLIGSPGSGRTTAMLTLVTAFSLAEPPDRLHFHLIDFAGHQLRAALASLPQVAGVYGPDDQDRIGRLLVTLQGELDMRRTLFEAAGAVGLSGYRKRQTQGEQLPAILTVINGFSGFREAFIDDLGEWIGLLREGGAYGLYFALSSDRLPTGRVTDLIRSRIALRIADRTMYSLILDGRPDLTTYDPVPGRGFWGSKPPLEVQIALPATGGADEQISSLREQSERMSAAWVGARPAAVKLLGDEVSLAQVLHAGQASGRELGESPVTWIGMNDQDLRPVEFDARRVGSYFLISGPPESGKTTSLATLALSVAAVQGPEEIELAFITPNRAERYRLDELKKLPHTLGQGKTESTVAALIEHLLSVAGKESTPHRLLLIDDYHLLSGRVSEELLDMLRDLARKGADAGLTTALTLPSTVLGTVPDPLVRQAKAWRSGLWLQSMDAMEAGQVGVKIPVALRGRELPPGRGFLYDPGGQEMIQLASPEVGWESAPGSLEDWVRNITT